MLDWSQNRPARPPKTAADPARMLALAREIWAETADPHGTLLEIFLWSQQLRLHKAPRALRLHRSLLHKESGERRPAMVARVDHPARGFCAVHCTYLAIDGSQKATLDPVRKTIGTFAGGAVRFGRPDPSRWLVIAEGIETTLSVGLALHCPSWAALSTGGLVALRLPPEAGRVLIAADNDLSGDGERIARLVQARMLAEGRETRVMLPPQSGTDWNDVLRGRADAR